MQKTTNENSNSILTIRRAQQLRYENNINNRASEGPSNKLRQHENNNAFTSSVMLQPHDETKEYKRNQTTNTKEIKQ
jgi:hypothetical protein